MDHRTPLYAVQVIPTDSSHLQPPPSAPASAPPVLHAHAIHDIASEQSRLQESLKRSITLVFWYKAGCEPIRLHQEIPTFPLFQLSQFSQLINDLGFSSNSWVDMYNPHTSTWEQQTVATVRVVDSEQRLLYRVRKSLLEGLSHDECPGVVHEINMQGPDKLKSFALKSPMKRPAAVEPESQDTCRLPKYSRMDGSTSVGKDPISPAANPEAARGYPQVLPVSSQPPGSDVPPPQSYPVAQQPQTHDQVPSPQIPTHMNLDRATIAPDPNPDPSAAGRAPVPYSPHPPLKRWPNDYTVSEIATGFRQMDSLIAQQPTLTQKLAFERIFGCRYIKSTVCRHRAVWKKADSVTKESYEAMGLDERAVWGDFVKKVEGRLIKDNPRPVQMQSQALNMMNGVQQSIGPSVSMPPMTPQHGGLDMGASLSSRRMDDEPVMASLGPPPGHPGAANLHTGPVA